MRPACALQIKPASCVCAAAETALLDGPFWMHPGALGHTLEALLPLFSTLRHEPLLRRTPDRLLLLFQQRSALGDWVRSLLAAALGVLPGQDLPPLIFQHQVSNPLQQPESLLEGVGPGEWLMFEQVGTEGQGRREGGCDRKRLGPRPAVALLTTPPALCPLSTHCLLPQVLWPKDMFQGGPRTARDQLDARLLRALVWAQHGVDPPPPGESCSGSANAVTAAHLRHSVPHSRPAPPPPPPAAGSAHLPRVALLLRKSANRRLLNEAEVAASMREELGEGWEVRGHSVISESCLWLAVHGASLATVS